MIVPEMIDISVSISRGLLHGVHSVTGLPWFASIPLTAFLVRMTIGLPQQWWTRSQVEKRSRLTPMLTAWRKVHQKRVMDSYTQNGQTVTPSVATKMVTRALKKTESQMYKRWRIYKWAPYSIVLQFPVFLSMMEALRRMVGMDGGLLTVLKAGFGETSGENVVPLEPSMATGGALWFPDLLAHDPTHVLPVVLATTLYLNISLGWKPKSEVEIATLPPRAAFNARILNKLRFGLQCVPFYIAPSMIAAQVPSGFLLYWISSTLIATLQTKIIKDRFTAVPVPRECYSRHVGSVHDPKTK